MTGIFNRCMGMLLQRISLLLPGGYTLRPFTAKLRGAKVGKNVWISQMVYIDELHPEALTIGDNVTIGLRTSILTHFYWGGRRETTNMGPVVIEKDVFIGPHCVILPGVLIGEGSVIMAGTVISRNIPPHTLWGPPATGPLGEVTVSLTARHSYQEFVRGLRPIRKINTGDPPD
jgi:acetyltransferase-like isoleucine patch superfamily enzyme